MLRVPDGQRQTPSCGEKKPLITSFGQENLWADLRSGINVLLHGSDHLKRQSSSCLCTLNVSNDLSCFSKSDFMAPGTFISLWRSVINQPQWELHFLLVWLQNQVRCLLTWFLFLSSYLGFGSWFNIPLSHGCCMHSPLRLNCPMLPLVQTSPFHCTCTGLSGRCYRTSPA